VKFLASTDDNLEITASAIDEDFAGNDWIIFRYADVYLMYIEAVMAGNNLLDVSNSLVVDNVNSKFYFEEIRKRAGVVDYTVQQITKEDLLNERRLELAFENHRFFDLVRFGEAEAVLQNYGLESGNIFTEFDLLLPIPNREIVLSDGIMSQNDGY